MSAHEMWISGIETERLTPEGRAARRFTFDCPSCRRRLQINRAQRGALIRCDECDLLFPAPDFRRSRLDPAPPARDRPYACPCPVCGCGVKVREGQVGGLQRCDDCGWSFPQPTPAWERWQRPVAKIFTRADQRRSLHHLMLSTDRRWFPDQALNARERRRFDFYCGACGRLQQARVWDIAAQRNCRWCDALMIIPAPRHARRAPIVPTEWSDNALRQADRGALYCPQCGTPLAAADHTRHRMSHCLGCGIWF